MERLDKTVSKAGALSRTEARGFILRGLVSVDGQAVRDIGFKVDPQKQSICLKGKLLSYKKYVYIVMNKPKGVISAGNDKAAKTVVDLLDDNLKKRKLFPVGRLDKNTTGLLIITDDGDFAHKLLSPSKKVPKEYIVTLDGDISENLVSEFAKGLTLADGTNLAPAELEILNPKNRAKVKIVEGKYHQIKRMFGLFNLGVDELQRVSFGGLKLPKDIEEGEFREADDFELEILNK